MTTLIYLNLGFSVCIMIAFLCVTLKYNELIERFNLLKVNTHKAMKSHQKILNQIVTWMDEMDTSHNNLEDDISILFKLVDYLDVPHLDNCSENRGGKCSCGKRQARINFFDRLEEIKNGEV